MPPLPNIGDLGCLDEVLGPSIMTLIVHEVSGVFSGADVGAGARMENEELLYTLFVKNEYRAYLRFALPTSKIDDVKLLINLTVLVPDNHLSLLSIDSSMYIHNLSFLVHNVWSLESEELPPS